MKTTEARELFYLAHGEYPNFRTQREGKLEFSFKKTATPEGSINALGIDTGITGKHAEKIICDDFATLKDRISTAEREKTISMIQEIRTNIIDQGYHCGFIGTPWHKKDAWSILPKPLVFDVEVCGILSKKEIEEKRKITLPSLFAANYLLKHISDEGRLFNDPFYKPWLLSYTDVWGHIDSAFDGVDTCGLTFMAKKSSEGRIQAFGKVYGGNVKNWIDTIEAEYRKRRCKGMYVESNTDKGYTADLLRQRGIHVVDGGYHESQNKHIKISSHLYDAWKKIDWDPETDIEYMEQVIDYEKNSGPDDCPDSAASLIREKFSSINSQYDALYND